jgi:hypothetical protein
MCVEVANVLRYLVIGPHGIRKYHTMCCYVLQATQLEARSEISAPVSVKFQQQFRPQNVHLH